MRLIQLQHEGARRVALVAKEQVRVLRSEDASSIYDLAWRALNVDKTLAEVADEALGSELLDYDSIWSGESDSKVLPAFDHPRDPAHCLVSGTGLTHKASADNRSAMHGKPNAITDSQRMYQMGLEGGRPDDGAVGVQPEWFYKGNGSILAGHGDVLTVPEYANDGGEEPEIAGAYIISPSGEPVRVGLTVANEFSDHVMEKKNYLYLAPSKLRQCAIGPELTVGDVEFTDVSGEVQISRNGHCIWKKEIRTGESNMSHSIRNLEHHHFKYAAHRQPGDVHIHFFGATAFSFGAGVTLADGDWMEISFPQFGRPLRNQLRYASDAERPFSVRSL